MLCFDSFICCHWRKLHASPQFFNKESKVSIITFHKELAKELLHNSYLPNIPKHARKQDWSKDSDHVLLNIPAHKKFKGTKLMPSKTDYPKVNCLCCAKTKVRNYVSAPQDISYVVNAMQIIKWTRCWKRRRAPNQVVGLVVFLSVSLFSTLRPQDM